MSLQTERKPWGAVSEVVWRENPNGTSSDKQLVLCPICGNESCRMVASTGFCDLPGGPVYVSIEFKGDCGHSWTMLLRSTTQTTVSSLADDPADLRTMSYEDYLQTEHWKQERRAALARANYHCQLCHTSSPNGRGLNVHHNTYERRGAEEPEDLIVLCQTCHARHHGKLP